MRPTTPGGPFIPTKDGTAGILNLSKSCRNSHHLLGDAVALAFLHQLDQYLRCGCISKGACLCRLAAAEGTISSQQLLLPARKIRVSLLSSAKASHPFSALPLQLRNNCRHPELARYGRPYSKSTRTTGRTYFYLQVRVATTSIMQLQLSGTCCAYFQRLSSDVGNGRKVCVLVHFNDGHWDFHTHL